MKTKFLLLVPIFFTSVYAFGELYEKGKVLPNKTIESSFKSVKESSLSTVEIIKNSLKLNLPALEVDQITQTVIPGIYEITSGRKIFYTDSSGKYAILGNLVDLNTKENLTMEKVEQLNMGDWGKLPLKIALKQVIGSGKYKIAVFSDPNCVFCKRLETEVISKLTDVTVYYFLFPLPNHFNSKSDAQKILCSENPESTFINFMKDNISLPSKTECNNAQVLTQMLDVGKNIIHVEVAPTIVLNNGKVVHGVIPADELNRMIIDAAPKLIDIKTLSSSKK